MSDNIHSIQIPPNDGDLANEILGDARPHLEALCAIMQAARKHGLELQFQISTTPFGQCAASATIVKPLARI